MKVLVTGGAGFIGSHLCDQLVHDGSTVVALDNFDPFYPADIKLRNLSTLKGSERFRLVEADIRYLDEVEAALASVGHLDFDVIVHLAARAGVRPSIDDPILYSQVNLDGTTAMLELARRHGVSRFIFGSSSSVYGNNAQLPFSEDDRVERPISPYAATKRAGELLCHTYHHIYDLSVVCLRFFTVYGPRQRPDLAIHKFTRLMSAGEPIPMFGDGTTERDYTFIDDILQGIRGAIEYTDVHSDAYEIVNLGESETTTLARLIELLSGALGVQPEIRRLPPQPGDVQRTFADITKARRLLGYEPAIKVEQGISQFVEWYKDSGDWKVHG